MVRLDLSSPKQGIFLKLPSTQVVDILAEAGYDFVIVDLEHAQLTAADAVRLTHHAEVLGLPAIVRLPRLDVGLVNVLLEAGAAGIQLSTVTSAEQVADLRAAMTYAPAGARSVGNAHRLAGYGFEPLPDYIARADAHPPLAVIQIETPTTVDPLADIAAAGADVFFVGRGDLSVAYRFDKAQIDAREDEILTAAAAAGIAGGGIGSDPERTAFRVVGADMPLLAKALKAALA
jgi:4-hydroxy-2-oxoheptanedioate aldolase